MREMTRRLGRLQLSALFGAVISVTATLTGVGAAATESAVSAVYGQACGIRVAVGLFGGPQESRGCGTGVPPTAESYSPNVALPPDGSGSATPTTEYKALGTAARMGPATLAGGRWPEELSVAPRSGPITVSTHGTPGAGGSVTSSVDIELDTLPEHESANDGAGGYGPFPDEGDELHVACSASASGVSGTTTLVNAQLATETDADGNPTTIEDVPLNPPVNYTRHGEITNVGDVFTVVYNEQIVHSDGSLTVNAVHLYLFGPTAIGEIVKGQVRCGGVPSPLTGTDTVAPTCRPPLLVAPFGTAPPRRQELIGVFDARGLESIANIYVVNGTVQVGDPGAGFDYLKFTRGQTGPLRVVAERTQDAQDAGLPMYWSFDVTDLAGNVRHCRGAQSPPVARTDYYTTPANTPIVVPFPGVLGNDTDHEDDSLTAVASTYPPPDTAVVGSDGSFVFAPEPLFSGVKTFTYTISDGYGTDEGLIRVRVGPGSAPTDPVADFDGDARTDVSVFRPSAGTWFAASSSGAAGTTQPFGVDGDIPLPADYNGDGTTDVAVFRPSTALWARGGDPLAATSFTTYGVASDVPVPADYDGDRRADIGVYRPSTGTWYVHRSSDGTESITTFGGLPGDVPVPADYDGDGSADLGVFRPADGSWYSLPSAGGSYVAGVWGAPGDIPVAGDYDGDGKADIAVYRPSTGLWAAAQSSGGQMFMTYGGVAGDVPVPGDYDGDARTDVAVFRPSAAAWWVHHSSGASDAVSTFGLPTDTPLPIAYAVRNLLP